ncbi:odorant receptor 10a-like [Bradysia coprophila]|uniref:odorant receptor 10a-like n=1 Tax=Bradysia coprophila TaxID=38358 RepID=UPI00187D74B2|nr:odorant receptor 10a-like [Bradysia coprophila]
MGLLPSPTDKPLDEQQIEKEYLRVPRFALRLLGYWPHDKLLSFRVLPFTVLSLTIISLGVAVEVAFSYTHINSASLALEALCPALTKSVTIIKFVMLLLTRSKVANMLNDIKQKWINDKSPESSYENLRACRASMVAAMILICFSNGAATGYFLRPVVTMAYQYFTGKEIVRTLPFKSEYPYDEYADPIYTLTYIVMSSTGTICAFGLSGMDGIFVSICLQISAQFRILKRNFEQMTADYTNVQNERILQYSKAENQELNQKLKVLIRRHQDTIQMNDDMVNLFLVNIFSHFVSAALVLCCVSVNLLLTRGGLWLSHHKS